jgi:hypothetical protein
MMLRLYAVTAKIKMNIKLQTAFVIIYTCRLALCAAPHCFYLLGINDAAFIIR